MPSLLASPEASFETSGAAAEGEAGILAVVGQGHARGRSPVARHLRVGAVATALLLGALAWWWAWPLRAGSAVAHEQVASVHGNSPQLVTARPTPSSAQTPVPATVAPAPSAARIELAEEPVAQQLRVEAQAPGATPGLDEPSSAAQQSIPGGRRETLRAGRGVGESVRRPAAAARTADPDVEVIEVLMSRAAPEPSVPRPAATGRRLASPDPDRDVVLVQAGVPTAELVRRCLALGWLEGQLCRARVCAARHDDEAACPRQATALGSP
ncbi:MAG: hypothetical protein ACK4ZD_06550 [Caldimonas sp.]|uniref:hypothetical protein n=1 Tax=Caldimonas sp. TaxID=2838790 RepID=UPI00391B63F2